jgi:hypothetical protein
MDVDARTTGSRSTVATGPLNIHPNNPRYFADGSGKVIYLAGSNWGLELQDDAWDIVHTFDYRAYLDFLVAYNHNLIRLWVVEHTRSDQGPSEAIAHPMPYARSNVCCANDGGNKFDLDRWDEAFFIRLRERVIAARDRGIYVSLMLFQGVSIWDHQGQRHQFGHPFHVNNNVNGVDGDLNGDGHLYGIHSLVDPGITARQEAYVRQVIDAVNDLDNVLYEIANEDRFGSLAWHEHMIGVVKSYEGTKPKQHPVGMTKRPTHHDSELFASLADWVSPTTRDILTDPPVSDGSKVVVYDTDHGNPRTRDAKFPWRSFLRGNNTLVLDWDLIKDLGSSSGFDGIRRAMGDTRAYADKMNLTAAAPSDSVSHCSTRYVLRNPGVEYLAYQPESGPFSVALEAGTYDYEWFDPSASSVRGAGRIVTEGKSECFGPPFDGPAVLYLRIMANATELQ